MRNLERRVVERGISGERSLSELEWREGWRESLKRGESQRKGWREAGRRKRTKRDHGGDRRGGESA